MKDAEAVAPSVAASSPETTVVVVESTAATTENLAVEGAEAEVEETTEGVTVINLRGVPLQANIDHEQTHSLLLLSHFWGILFRC